MDRKKLVTQFFEYMDAFHRGDESAIEKMLDIWDDEGSFEFAGAYPLVGEFRGRAALNVLFKNLANSSSMPVLLEKKGDAVLKNLEVKLTEVELFGDRAMANFEQVVSTKDNRGIFIVGSGTFTFKEHEITNVKLTVMPLPKLEGTTLKVPERLSMKELTIRDIGRLSLAAWAVV